MSVRVRFAPSPTGYLHIGGARTALFNWLYARHEGGTFVLRIEDTDADRSTSAFEEAILREFQWLGIDWDEGPIVGGPHAPYRQTERLPSFQAAAERLLASGKAYRCTCTAERLDALRQSQKDNALAARGYDGHCRDLGLGADCGPHVVRLRVPDHGETVVDDLVKGPVAFRNTEIDDFILVRSDGVPTYNFVVVCDDAAMEITHVLRAAEHLNNTPKQMLLYEALGAPMPRFGHVPLILALDGSKMSKRHGATSVGAYRELGFLPEAMLNYLARLGWAHGDQELFTQAELVAAFTVEAIGNAPGKWDMDKLLWVNAHWLRTLPLDRIVADARSFFEAQGCTLTDTFPLAVEALRPRARTLLELAAAGRFLYVPDDALEVDLEAIRAHLAPSVAQVSALADVLAAVPGWTEAEVEAAVQAWCLGQGTKLGKVAQPLRVAMSGQKVGPGLFQTMVILGRETTLRRLRRASVLVAMAQA